MSSKKRMDEMKAKNRRVATFVFILVAGMVGLSFASVPLYDLFCRVTGFGGTPQVADSSQSVEVLERTIRVQFNADVNRELPWAFEPEQRSIEVQLGERGLASYTAKNTSHKPAAGTALYNVTPLKAGKYFNKVQCFCFEEQVLQPGQRVSMPVLFYVDPAMDEDPAMDDVKVITLSYTFFRTEGNALEQALEDFYNEGAI